MADRQNVLDEGWGGEDTKHTPPQRPAGRQIDRQLCLAIGAFVGGEGGWEWYTNQASKPNVSHTLKN